MSLYFCFFAAGRKLESEQARNKVKKQAFVAIIKAAVELFCRFDWMGWRTRIELYDILLSRSTQAAPTFSARDRGRVMLSSQQSLNFSLQKIAISPIMKRWLISNSQRSLSVRRVYKCRLRLESVEAPSPSWVSCWSKHARLRTQCSTKESVNSCFEHSKSRTGYHWLRQILSNMVRNWLVYVKRGSFTLLRVKVSSSGTEGKPSEQESTAPCTVRKSDVWWHVFCNTCLVTR